MVLWVFDGNMVGKWTNEPCNGVDEVVNPFWVITLPMENLGFIMSSHKTVKEFSIPILVAISYSLLKNIDQILIRGFC